MQTLPAYAGYILLTVFSLISILLGVYYNKRNKTASYDEFLSARSGIPLPVAISGKYRFLSKINVYIQKPIHVKSENGEKLTGDELQEVSDYLIQMLLHTAGYGEKPIKKETYTWTLE